MQRLFPLSLTPDSERSTRGPWVELHGLALEFLGAGAAETAPGEDCSSLSGPRECEGAGRPAGGYFSSRAASAFIRARASFSGDASQALQIQ